jgi:hypothetical protein
MPLVPIAVRDVIAGMFCLPADAIRVAEYNPLARRVSGMARVLI